MDEVAPVRRGPGRPPLNRNKVGNPSQPSWRPTQQRTSSYTPQRPSSSQQQYGGSSTQQQSGDQTGYIPPHLHPAYKGRGRPPLALGRRQVPPGGQAPPTQSSSKPSNYVSQRTRAAASAAAASVSQTGSQHGHRHQHAQQSGHHQQQGQQHVHHHRQVPLIHIPTHPSLGPLQSFMHKEPPWIHAGGTNRLLLSLKSAMPSHVRWALSRMVHNSVHLPDHFALDAFPGMLETLIRLVRQLISALQGESAEKWDPALLEQKERSFDGMGMPPSQENVEEEEDDDEDDDDEDVDGEEDTSKTANSALVVHRNVKQTPTVFRPNVIPSHQRLLENAISSLLILRNASLNERNEKMMLNYSRSLNALVADILTISPLLKGSTGPQEWMELPGLQEMRIYALDILELTRIRLHLRTRLTLDLDEDGVPKNVPDLTLPENVTLPVATGGEQNGGAANEKANATITRNTRISHQIFGMLVWLLHTTNDRTMLIGCLRCLGALAAEEKNEISFIEADVTVGRGIVSSTPGILRKCLSLLPLTQDGALLEAALDCLYQIINVGDNALRLGVVADVRRNELDKDVDDVVKVTTNARSIVGYLVRDLMYGRVVWDRSHQLTLHPALHGHVPSAVNIRRREREELWRKRKRADGQDDKEIAKQRRLNKEEWVKIKDMAEPERLGAWMRMIYEAKDEGEVTQMEFWATYSSQFGPYSQLGGPALLAAAEVIRSVSTIFPGALAMVLPNQRFIVRGVQPRDRGHLRKYECRWKDCTQPETESYRSVEDHVRRHCSQSDDGVCAWASCTFVVPGGDQMTSRKEHLRLHALTHLPESEEAASKRDEALYEKHRFADLLWKARLKSAPLTKATMPNGARFISGPTALMPSSSVGEDWHKLECERQDAKRRKTYNLPTRGTVDLPDLLGFSVTRTPMDPQSQRPTGIASSASLILRTMARVAASVLTKAGERRQRARGLDNKADGDATTDADRGSGGGGGVGGNAVGGGIANSEKFGLPLPPIKASAGVETADATADGVQTNGQSTGAIVTGGVLLPVLDEDAVQRAAEGIMDGLFDVEDDLIQVAGENDILCPTLNEILSDLRPERGQTLVPKRDVDGESDEILLEEEYDDTLEDGDEEDEEEEEDDEDEEGVDDEDDEDVDMDGEGGE